MDEELKRENPGYSADGATSDASPQVADSHGHHAGFDIVSTTEELLAGTDDPEREETGDEVTTRIFTVANLISLIRLCLIPAFVVLLFDGHNYLAAFIFALAAGTDFIDGYLARSTHTVSRLGRVLDPAVDRLLMITGVVCVYLLGRLPLWIIVVVLARDLMLLLGGGYLIVRYKVRVPVVFAGKLATTLFFLGILGLLLNWPLVNGLGVVDISWLPGLNSEVVPLGIWFIYAGLVVALFTTIYYVATALMKAGVVKNQEIEQREIERKAKEAESAQASSQDASQDVRSSEPVQDAGEQASLSDGQENAVEPANGETSEEPAESTPEAVEEEAEDPNRP